MRVLVLDDDNTRHRTFQRNLIGHERVLHVHTADEACAAVNAEQFDAVFLDHDLNHFEYVSMDYNSLYGGSKELTGVDVARCIARLAPEKQPKLIIVHSFNGPGALNIVAALKGTRSQVVRQLFNPGIGLNLSD